MATDTDTTSQRILEAAGEVFAHKGFESATVREICKRANANLAAVNYHFGDKRRLYIETVKRAHANRLRQFPLPDWPPETSPQQKLADFVRVMLLRFTSPTDASWEGELMSRELTRPSEACRAVAQESIRPEFSKLDAVLAEILPQASEVERHLIIFSIVGQCLHYKYAAPIIRSLVTDQEYETYQPELLAKHIIKLTLHGMGSF